MATEKNDQLSLGLRQGIYKMTWSISKCLKVKKCSKQTNKPHDDRDISKVHRCQLKAFSVAKE